MTACCAVAAAALENALCVKNVGRAAANDDGVDTADGEEDDVGGDADDDEDEDKTSVRAMRTLRAMCRTRRAVVTSILTTVWRTPARWGCHSSATPMQVKPKDLPLPPLPPLRRRARRVE